MRFVKEKGIVTLMLTVVILLLITLTTLYTARVVVTDDKVFANVYREQQANNAASAGFDYALGFLNANLLNQEMVLTNNVMTRAAALPGGNNLNACSAVSNAAILVAPTPFNNNTSISYRCITVNDNNTIQIQSIGRSDDNSATKTVLGIVQRVQPTVSALTSVGVATLNNTVNITNTFNNNKSTKGIISGSPISFGAAGTKTVTTSAGSCTSVAACLGLSPPAVTQSDPTLFGLTTAPLFETKFMGNVLANFSSQADYVLTCNNNVTYTALANTLTDGGNCSVISVAPGVTPANPTWAQLNATKGRVIFYTMGAGDSISFSGFVAGSPTARNIIIVNQVISQNVTLGNNAVYYGGIYTTGSLQATGNAATILNGVGFTSNDYTQDSGVVVNGVVMARTKSGITANGSSINRNSSVILSYVQGGSVLGFAVVPGSVKDF